MSEDITVLLKLLTGGEKDHVRILCEDGEVRINTFVLGALSAILTNIIMSLEESNALSGEKVNIFLFKEIKKKDMLLLFQCLFQQVPEFSPPPKLMELVQSFLFSGEEGDTIVPEEMAEEIMDFTSILDVGDHDYHDQQKPVVIPIRKEQKEIKENKNSAVAQITNTTDEDQEGIYECHICPFKIPYPKKRKQRGRPGGDPALMIETEHLFSVHGLQPLHSCHLCHLRCFDLEKHLERGHFRTKCPICGKYRPSKQRMELCMSVHKKKEARELETKTEKVCPHCGKVCKDIYRLNEHVGRSCPGIQYEEPTCEQCGKKCKNPYAYRQHILLKHSGREKPQYVCNMCGKILLSMGSLRNHHEAFHGIRELKIKCELCGKLCVDKGALKAHMRFHAEKKTCPICGFKTRNLKMHHMSVHTKDEEKEFQCDQCDKGFITKKYLERHKISVHLKTKPYNCRYGCVFSYNDMANRNAHERKTHGSLFYNHKEEKLKEKIKMLGVDEKTFANPII